VHHERVPVPPGRELRVDVDEAREQLVWQLQNRLVRVERDQQRRLQRSVREPPQALLARRRVALRVEHRREVLARGGEVAQRRLALGARHARAREERLLVGGKHAAHRGAVVRPPRPARRRGEARLRVSRARARARADARAGVHARSRLLVRVDADERRALEPGLDEVKERGLALARAHRRRVRLRAAVLQVGAVAALPVGEARVGAQAQPILDKSELHALEAARRVLR
jgi:hypothetical protein